MQQPLLTTHGLSIGYATREVQHALTLQAYGGCMIGVLGKNGCGKSTLLRTLAGLQPPLKGEIRIKDKPMPHLAPQEKARLLSLVLTERQSINNARVSDIVAMGRYPYSSFLGTLDSTDKKEIEHAISCVNMTDKAGEYFNCLSDGEKQRVLVAKALAQQTPIILLDEPTAHLDLNNRIKILLLLRSLAHEQQKCIIISTHELDLALQMADLIWLMTPQRGIETGTPEALTTSGAFQTAFEDDSFLFENHEGQLRVVVKKR